MNALPDVKLRVMTLLPPSIRNGIGVNVEKRNGIYTFLLDYSDIDKKQAIPVGEYPQTWQLFWNDASGGFTLVPYTLPSAKITGTSTTSNSVSTGTKNFSAESGIGWTFGTRLRAADTENPDTYIEGIVVSYDVESGALELYADTAAGSGTVSDWSISVTGDHGSGDVDSGKNLSDLSNIATARVNLGDFAIAGDLEAADIPAVQIRVTTRGCLDPDDRGGADWDYVPSEPSHDAKRQSSDGKWWQIAPTNGVLMSRQLGLHAPSVVTDCAVAMQGFFNAAVALKATAKLTAGDTYYFTTGTVNLPEGLDLDMTGATLVRDSDLTVPLLQCVGASGARKGGGRIRGGLLKYTASTTTNTITNSTALWLKFCHDWRVECVYITGPFYIGFRFDDCLDTVLDTFSARGVYNRALYIGATEYTENVHCLNGLCDGYAPGTSTRVTNHIINTNAYGTGSGRNVTFTNIVSRNGTTSPAGEGFAFSDRIHGQKAINCKVFNCPTGFNIQKANGQANQNVELVNCEADTCDRGFIGTDCFYIDLIGCKSLSHTVAGFQFTDCVDVGLVGCRASGAGTGTCDGFLFLGSTSGVSISGCRAYNNTGTGFKSEATCSDIVGRGNRTALNGTATNMLGLTNSIDFPTAFGSGNMIH